MLSSMWVCPCFGENPPAMPKSSFWGRAPDDALETLDDIYHFRQGDRIVSLKHYGGFCRLSLQAGAKAAANSQHRHRLSIVLIKYILLYG